MTIRVHLREAASVNHSVLDGDEQVEYRERYFNLTEAGNEQYHGYYTEVDSLEELVDRYSGEGGVTIRPSKYVEADYSVTIQNFI